MYSKHTYILPFVIKGRKNVRTASKNWKLLTSDLPYIENNPNLAYAYKRYFNDEAAEILSQNQDLVENYVYLPPKEESMIYRISFFEKDDALRWFDLEIDYVMMRYFPSLNAAFLVMSSINRNYDDLDDIKLINQYGRRIFTPFLTPQFSLSEAPNDIELLSKEDTQKAPQFSEKLKAYEIMSAPLRLLQSFFGMATEDIFPETDKNHSRRQWLDTIIDDRMFVHTFVQSPQLASLIGKTSELDSLSLEDQKQLYAWAFIDRDDATCSSQDMLKAILSETLYARWATSGSLYLFTQHSLLYLSGSDQTPSYLIDYFQAEYADMVMIVLSQRMGILKYSHEAGSRVKSPSRDILKLQEQYVRFKNQFLLAEVTAQEQGIDIYRLLQNSLYIDRHLTLLDNQISSLNEIGQIKSGNMLNWVVFGLTLMTVFPLLIDESWTLSINTIAIPLLQLCQSTATVVLVIYVLLKTFKR